MAMVGHIPNPNEGLIAYQIHQACIVHTMSDTYNAFEYNFKTRADINSFNKSPLKWQYISAQRKMSHSMLKWYFYYVSKHHPLSFHKKPFNQAWIKQAEDHAKELIAYYKVVNEKNNFLELVDTSDSHLYPKAYQMFCQNELSYDKIMVVELSHPFLSGYEGDPLSWHKFKLQCAKDIGFINIAVNHLIFK